MNRDWRNRALCRYEEDKDLFYPIGNTGPALRQIEAAKAICWKCPVISDCLEWALDTNQDFGVWGGKSEYERRSLKRRNTTQTRINTASLPHNARAYLNGASRDRFMRLVEAGRTLRQIADTLHLGLDHVTTIATRLGVTTTADAA